MFKTYSSFYTIIKGGENVKKTSVKNNQKENRTRKKINLKVTFLLLFLFGVILIFATYAWFSTNLNVKIKTFNMVVTKNSGLSISFDAINFDTSVEISSNMLVNELKRTYPNNLSQWASNGLTPVSSIGITNPNNYFFDMYYSGGGVLYSNKNRERGYIKTTLTKENEIKKFSRYIAFDLFFRNETGSPAPDNLYFDPATMFTFDEDASDEMKGLLNSIRVGIVKVGSLPLDANPTDIQNIKCNNNCTSIIYEPFSTKHEGLSIERSKKFNIDLKDGENFPTYACVKETNLIYVGNTVSGSPNLDTEYFKLQSTMKESDLDTPLFKIPDGITKTRIYLWIEGQDIDSLETDSEGSDLSISLGFVKDTAGYIDLPE